MFALELGHVLFDRPFLRERPGQHELGFEHGVDGVGKSVQSRRQISMDRVLDPAPDVVTDRPVLRPYQLRFSVSVATPS